MNNLFIDSANNERIVVRLTIDDQVDEKVFTLKSTRSSQVILPAIDDLLKKHNLTVQQIDKIEVNKGPGSYTGVRVGVSIANALGFTLQVSVNDKKVGEFIKPKYE